MTVIERHNSIPQKGAREEAKKIKAKSLKVLDYISKTFGKEGSGRRLTPREALHRPPERIQWLQEEQTIWVARLLDAQEELHASNKRRRRR